MKIQTIQIPTMEVWSYVKWKYENMLNVKITNFKNDTFSLPAAPSSPTGSEHIPGSLPFDRLRFTDGQGKFSISFLLSIFNLSINSQMWWKAQVFTEFPTQANFSQISSLSPPLYSPASSTSPPLDHSGEPVMKMWTSTCGLRRYLFLTYINISRVGGATYLQLPTGLPTVLPNGLILATTKPKGSHKSYSEKRRCHKG